MLRAARPGAGRLVPPALVLDKPRVLQGPAAPRAASPGTDGRYQLLSPCTVTRDDCGFAAPRRACGVWPPGHTVPSPRPELPHSVPQPCCQLPALRPPDSTSDPRSGCIFHGATMNERMNENENLKASGETSLGDGMSKTSPGITGRPIFSALRVQREPGHGEAWAPTLPLTRTRRAAPTPDAPFWEPLVSMCKSSSRFTPHALLVRVERDGVWTPLAQE